MRPGEDTENLDLLYKTINIFFFLQKNKTKAKAKTKNEMTKLTV